jgi:hypothetical protein
MIDLDLGATSGLVNPFLKYFVALETNLIDHDHMNRCTHVANSK